MRVHAVGKGLKRRGKLMAQALSPPRPRPAGTVIGTAVGTVIGTAVGTAANAPDRRPGQKDAEAYVAPLATRLVGSPVFVLSSVRSGSTLLRVLLNSHSQIRAPHEMHLRTLHVQLTRPYSPSAMRALELDRAELEHLLWDRVLHLELERSGKEVIVDKTPGNTLRWRRLRRCWPDARYLFLRRHPGAVVSSLVNRRRDPDLGEIHAEVLGYAEAMEEAAQELDGHVLTYEKLTAEPEKTTRDICHYLGIEWEPGMLEYGRHDHGTFRPHMGDWSSNIRSGRIQPAREGEHHEGLPARLAEIAEVWGYHR